MSLPLVLSDPVTFEPVGKVTQVFYDQLRQQVLSIRSGGATGVMARGFRPARDNHTFRLTGGGGPDNNSSRINAIRLSPDQKTLVVLRDQRALELWPVKSGGQSGSLGDTCGYGSARNRGAAILGLSWLENSTGEGGDVEDSTLVLVTEQGIELHEVNAVEGDTRSLRFLRSHSQVTKWYQLSPATHLVVSSPAQSTHSLNIAQIKSGYPYRLNKIELEESEGYEPIKERDLSVCQLYKSTYVSVIAKKRSQDGTNIREVLLYKILGYKSSGSVLKSFVLKLPDETLDSPLAVNSVDDLLMVHSQNLNKTYVYDTECSRSGDSDGTVTYCNSPLATAAFQPEEEVTAYSQNWITFQPDVIVDAKLGKMWRAKLVLKDVDRLVESISDPSKLLSFLKRRRGAKNVVLKTLLRYSLDFNVRIRTLGGLLDQVNEAYRSYLDCEMSKQMALSPSAYSFKAIRQSLNPSEDPSSASSTTDASASLAKVVIDQADLFAFLFSPMMEQVDKEQKQVSEEDEEEDVNGPLRERAISLLMEYLRSLDRYGLPPAQHFLSELLIHLLVTSRRWFQLHVLLQYRVIADSKPLACLLLSLEKAYPPALQLALDMLHRLNNSTAEIVEVLLSKQLVIPALKLASSSSSSDCATEGGGGGLDPMPVRKFLEAAVEVDGGESAGETFLNVYEYFDSRRMIPKGVGAEYERIYKNSWQRNEGDD